MLPGGLLLQWKTLSIPDGTNGVVSGNWPIAFNTLYGAVPAIAGAASSSRKVLNDQATSNTLCAVNAVNTGTSLNTSCFVIGLGI